MYFELYELEETDPNKNSILVFNLLKGYYRTYFVSEEFEGNAIVNILDHSITFKEPFFHVYDLYYDDIINYMDVLYEPITAGSYYNLYRVDGIRPYDGEILVYNYQTELTDVYQIGDILAGQRILNMTSNSSFVVAQNIAYTPVPDNTPFVGEDNIIIVEKYGNPWTE